jgi:hypothetical protein
MTSEGHNFDVKEYANAIRDNNNEANYRFGSKWLIEKIITHCNVVYFEIWWKWFTAIKF